MAERKEHDETVSESKLSDASILLSLQMCEVQTFTLNLNIARDCKNRAELYGVLLQKKTDIIFLQETHRDAKNVIDWMKEWGGVSIFHHNSPVSG